MPKPGDLGRIQGLSSNLLDALVDLVTVDHDALGEDHGHVVAALARIGVTAALLGIGLTAALSRQVTYTTHLERCCAQLGVTDVAFGADAEAEADADAADDGMKLQLEASRPSWSAHTWRSCGQELSMHQGVAARRSPEHGSRVQGVEERAGIFWHEGTYRQHRTGGT